MKFLSVTILAFMLAGCQSGYNRYVAKELSNAEALIEEGKSSEAYSIVTTYLVNGGEGSKKAQSFITAHPEFKAKLHALATENINNISGTNGLTQPSTAIKELSVVAKNINNASTVNELAKTRAVIRELRAHDFIGAEDERQLLEHLGKVAVEGNQSGRFAIDYANSDLINEIPTLTTPEAQRIIFYRSLERLRTEPAPPTQLVKGVFEAAAKTDSQSEERKALGKALPQMRLTLEEIREYVATVFPALAQKMIGDSAVSVRLIVEPEDRLLQEDLETKIKNVSPVITIIENGQQPTITINVKKLQWEERQSPERTQPVMYSQGQVNILAAAMFMPQNASYIYDLSTGGIELSYAFEIKATGKGAGAYNKLLRDKVSEQWRTCSNARIQNVFGGVQPANFVANDQMQQVCGGGAPVSSEQVRDTALNRVIDSLKEIPAIAKAASL